MANEFRARVFNQAMGGFQADLMAASAEFQKAELAGDAETAAAWSSEMANIEVRATAYRQMAERAVAAQASQPAPNKYGLSDDQVEAARLCGVSDEVYAAGIPELAKRKKLGMYPDQ